MLVNKYSGKHQSPLYVRDEKVEKSTKLQQATLAYLTAVEKIKLDPSAKLKSVTQKVRALGSDYASNVSEEFSFIVPQKIKDGLIKHAASCSGNFAQIVKKLQEVFSSIETVTKLTADSPTLEQIYLTQKTAYETLIPKKKILEREIQETRDELIRQHTLYTENALTKKDDDCLQRIEKLYGASLKQVLDTPLLHWEKQNTECLESIAALKREWNISCFKQIQAQEMLASLNAVVDSVQPLAKIRSQMRQLLPSIATLETLHPREKGVFTSIQRDEELDTFRKQLQPLKEQLDLLNGKRREISSLLLQGLETINAKIDSEQTKIAFEAASYIEAKQSAQDEKVIASTIDKFTLTGFQLDDNLRTSLRDSLNEIVMGQVVAHAKVEELTLVQELLSPIKNATLQCTKICTTLRENVKKKDYDEHASNLGLSQGVVKELQRIQPDLEALFTAMKDKLPLAFGPKLNLPSEQELKAQGLVFIKETQKKVSESLFEQQKTIQKEQIALRGSIENAWKEMQTEFKEAAFYIDWVEYTTTTYKKESYPNFASAYSFEKIARLSFPRHSKPILEASAFEEISISSAMEASEPVRT